MMNTSRDRALVVEKRVVTHSWMPYSVLALLYTLAGLGWFATMIATVGYSSDSVATDTPGGPTSYRSTMLSMFHSFINLYLFRTLALFASLIVTYHAERHYLSRGSAWTSWTVNLLLLFSWLATDLPFVFSSFSRYSDDTLTGTNANALDSARNIYCGAGFDNYWCMLNYTHAVFSCIAGGLIGLTWLFSNYQLKRARGVSNLLLTWPELALINCTVFGIIGYIVWTLSTINLNITHQRDVFGLSDATGSLNTYRMYWPSLIWANYMIHAAFIGSLGTAAYVSFGGTTAPRMSAIIANWMSFMLLFPAFVYLARMQHESVGQCDNSQTGNYRCPSMSGVAAGMGIAMAINALNGLVMFAVLAQAETADFAVDMYGDKARAIDDARSTGSVPMKDVGAHHSSVPLSSIGTGVPVAGTAGYPNAGYPHSGYNMPTHAHTVAA